MPTTTALPALARQADRLIRLGIHRLAGISAADLRRQVAGHAAKNCLLVLHPDRVPASGLAPLIELGDKRGFVVTDLHDVDDFRPIEDAAPPEGPCYLVRGPERGDDLANWSPDEALPEIQRRGRTPLTLGEGIQWLLHQPGILQRGHSFMTIGSRLRQASGALDARVPAVWISNGTGRDGRHNRNAPKVGWCWAGNRHTWLGFASAATRIPLVSTQHHPPS